MLSFLFSLLMLMVALAMVVNTVSTQPLKLEESNKTDESPKNRDKVMALNSRQDALGCSLGCEGLENAKCHISVGAINLSVNYDKNQHHPEGQFRN